jgi:hypothetical protein
VTLNLSEQAAPEWRDYARRRYQGRPLFLACDRAESPPERSPRRDIHLFSGRPLEPGRALLLQLRAPGEGGTQTLLARVASTARRPDGSWLVRCRFAGEA